MGTVFFPQSHAFHMSRDLNSAPCNPCWYTRNFFFLSLMHSICPRDLNSDTTTNWAVTFEKKTDGAGCASMPACSLGSSTSPLLVAGMSSSCSGGVMGAMSACAVAKSPAIFHLLQTCDDADLVCVVRACERVNPFCTHISVLGWVKWLPLSSSATITTNLHAHDDLPYQICSILSPAHVLNNMTHDTCLCTTCMHRMIHTITLLDLGIISPSNILNAGAIVAYVLCQEIFNNKHLGHTTFTISSPSWYEVRHD